MEQSFEIIGNFNILEWVKIFRSNVNVVEKYLDENNYDDAIELGTKSLKIYSDIADFLIKEDILNKKDLKIIKNRFIGKTNLESSYFADLKLIKKLSSCVANAYRQKAQLLFTNNKIKESYSLIQQAYLLNSKDILINYTMGKILLSLNANKEAADSFEKVISYDKNYIEGRRILGELYASKDLADIDKSIFNYSEYLKKNKNNKQAMLSLAVQYSWLGMHNECEKICSDVIKIEPANENASIIYMLNLIKTQGYTQEQIKEITEKLVENYLKEKGVTKNQYDFANHNKKTNRKLKIGYLSSDFYKHIVSKFLLPVIENHNRENVEIHLYSTVKNPDAVTNKYIKLAKHYTDCTTMSLKELADKIYEDKIDILIDLNIFTGNSRIFTLALKPAPIQCVYLGYPNTSGLNTVDYILTDINTIKPDEAHLYTEEPAYIEEGYEIYKRDLATLPEINKPPYLKNKYVTMGVFNATSKVTTEMIDIWCSILKQTKNSKILFQYMKYYTQKNRERLIAQFEKNGVGKDRILFDDKDSQTHYNNIKKADFALDTYPYSGTGTTIDTIMMGLPIVCFEGFNATSRPTSRILKSLNEKELIAKNKEEYIKFAIDLINNPSTLLTARENLRSKLKTSRLTNYKAFCDSLEKTYQTMWEKYTAKYNGSLNSEIAAVV